MSTLPPQKRVPLSQAPGKQKLLVAVPSALVSGTAWHLGFFEAVTQFLALAFAVYALVGVIELLAGESLVRAAKQWDHLAGWKKLLIGLAVIVGALVLFVSLIPVLARVLYG